MHGDSDSRSSEGETNEVELLHQSVTDVTGERDALCEELKMIRQELEIKKARIKDLWRMSCGQA